MEVDDAIDVPPVDAVYHKMFVPVAVKEATVGKVPEQKI